MHIKYLLLLNCVTVANLYSAALPDRAVISREDRAAFEAIVQIYTIAQKCQGRHKELNNPALLFDTHRPNTHGITKTGLYIVKGHLGSPFGLIRLHDISRYRRAELSEFNSRFFDDKNAIATKTIESCSAMSFHDFGYFEGLRLRTVLSVDDKPVPHLVFARDFGQPTIDMARQKWRVLTAEHAATSPMVARWAKAAEHAVTWIRYPDIEAPNNTWDPTGY